MTKEELKQLFKEKILPHQRAPYHFETIEASDDSVLAYNPLCGDKFTLQLQKDSDSVSSAYFHGFGCAISQASTSLLIQRIEGKTQSQIVDLCQRFLNALDNDQPLDDEELRVLAALKKFDGRVDCITLPWKALLAHYTE